MTQVEAQKATLSIQSQNKQTVSKNAGKVTSSIHTQDQSASKAAETTVPTAQTTNDWRTYPYERLLGYDPAPQDGGEYIGLLVSRTREKYEHVNRLELTQDEKQLVSRSASKKSIAKINKVSKKISKYLKTLTPI
ncbi:MAG: hypothetical protein U9M90_00050 [Patescibacteria group bacterium]|nr:hypothetical protein [Patescibacteria group bacterium]